MKFIFWLFIIHQKLPRTYKLEPTPFTQCIILKLKVDAVLNTYYEDESFACLCIHNFGKTKTQYRFNGINDDEESEEIIELKSGDICIGPFKKMKSQFSPNNAQIIRVLFIINKTSAEMFLRNDGFDERIQKFKETNHFHLISTTFTFHIPSRRERDENPEYYGAGGLHERRNLARSKKIRNHQTIIL